MTRLLSFVCFIAGLAVAAWVASGYLSDNPLGLSMTLLIAAVYMVGVWELWRYHQSTTVLSRALSSLSEPVQALDVWLSSLPMGLRNAVRLRIKGERVALPGPALAPYLAGLLVLLGMLGTFLGMVVTLRGTGLALESATDLQAIRASLAAPVQGLGLAFGTSIAGVATSAMLGLLSSLSRRERLKASQLLDAQAATHLYVHTQAYQREESQKLLQSQTQAMPLLIDRLQLVATTLEQRSEVLAGAVERRTEALATALVERSETLAHTLDQRFQATTLGLDQRNLDLSSALEQGAQALSQQLISAQKTFHDKAQNAYTQLASSVEQSLKSGIEQSARAAEAAIEPVAQSTMQALTEKVSAMCDEVAQALSQHVYEISQQAQRSATTVADTWGNALNEQRHAGKTLADELRTSFEGHVVALEQRSEMLLADVAEQLHAVSNGLSLAWEAALTRQEQTNQQLSSHHQSTLTQAAAVLEQRAVGLLQQMHEVQTEQRGQLLEQDEKRISVWTAALAQMAAGLEQQWRQAAQESASHQQQICSALETAAASVAAQTREQAADTLAQLKLVALSVAEAPKAAAEAVAEVRQKLSESMVRDNAMLEERSRLLETLGTLLDAVNHASSEQSKAVDELVATSADVLRRVGGQFTDQLRAETEKLSGVAEQVVEGATQVASLGSTFAEAVQSFAQSNEALMANLQRIEQALESSLIRSDDQLAYYVAQAREVVDLSMLSQKQIIEELRQLSTTQASGGAAAV
ncbi:DUF802 domain-containing protein [Pusillimonas sp. CC-YST705]|uniref:DUF802 domain-containing protein n=1 Tax=Mesopusillimonas faecipullorum TaxID=2755040 RepID=A0ABS8CDD8_9BURK|nr:DUF802 domain-containing protein [Mesopusillimonas faecipullorum]MCB5364056.1 DUF802 domain-containing protein [Mesopusillimonas faecipullorum]